MSRCLLVIGLLAVAAVGEADVYVLRDGDRITGKTTFKGTKTFTVQTAYGRLSVPRTKVERILHDDGKEEILNPPPEPPPTPPPAAPVHLILVITGKTFWYAWDPPKNTAVDPSLKLEVRLDEDVVATYLDAKLDPAEIPGAMVNAFGFGADEVSATAATGVEVIPPEARPGRIVLKLDLPSERAGRRRLRLAYQVGDVAESSFRDVVEASVDVELSAETPSFIQIRQDRGRMEFSGFGKKKMKNVDSFKLEAKSE